MALSEKEILAIRKEIEYTKNPLYFFHDDPDGLASFLIFYRHIKEGKGIIIKTRPNIDLKFMRKVDEYQPDKIYILDIALVEQDFIDSVHVPIIWIDHHSVLERNGIKYYNPRKKDSADNIPVSTLSYDIIQEDLWIAMVGAVGDWTLPHFTDKFREEFPDLLPEDITTPPQALFTTPLGKLVKIFSFILKGTTKDAMKYVKVLTRIDSPYEILEQTSARGKFLYKRYHEINKDYQTLLDDIEKKSGKDDMIVHTYPENKMSFTGDVTNELLFMHPDKVILVGRVIGGEVKCSLRSPKDIVINDKLANALVGLEGYGGGHEHACGVVVKEEDFPTLIENLKSELGI
jgi:hypothetical protein